jgi:hypothetical protein
MIPFHVFIFPAIYATLAIGIGGGVLWASDSPVAAWVIGIAVFAALISVHIK